MASDAPNTTEGEIVRAAMRAGRRHRGISLIRLREDLKGAADAPVHQAGAIVEARWVKAGLGFAAGWQVVGCGFAVRLTNDQVETVEQ
jgi:hypothetical protein